MTTHIKALTYDPKINDVRSGKCFQTIRRTGKRAVKVGDTILLHGWEGRPYRSPWSWRMKVRVTHIMKMRFSEESLQIILGNAPSDPGAPDCFAIPIMRDYLWTSLEADELARRDGIDPPTGTALRDVLLAMGAKEGQYFQVIRWRICNETKR